MTDMNALESLYFAALGKPPAERQAFLAAACGPDADVRARVERLLAAQPHVGGFLDADQRTATFADPDAVPTADFPGKDVHADAVIARKYTLVEPIGEGGMGSVWRAKQTEPVKRFVALKLIKAGMDSRHVLARFEAERQALALMDHPNIAKVLDGGLHDQRPFFVMELVKGVPITDYCDAHRLTPQSRLELFVQACHAIQHAHQKGIIHRDLKPSNVLVALYDDRPVVKVIDFGVAKATGGTLTEATLDTGFGAVVGTPSYMSPEQATFNNLDIDTRSDVYALGVLLYELLVGSPPFSRKELEKKGLLEVLRVVREEEPPRPSVKLSTADALPSLSVNRGTDPRKLTGLLRNELDWIVMKALEKDRTRRYDTANGFAADVQRYLAGEPVQAVPPSTGYRVRKFVRRHRGQVVASLLVAASLCVGLGVSVWQANRAAKEAAKAIAALDELRNTAPAFAEQARALAARERFDEAVEKLDYAATLCPDEPAYPLAKADLLRCQFRFAEAADAYRGALRLRPGDPRIEAKVALCEELRSAPRSDNGQLSRENLSRLLAAMQKDGRPAAELMPVSRLLGAERQIALAYWQDRFKELPVTADRPLARRLTVRDDGLLALDLGGTKIVDLTPLEGAPLAVLDLTGANDLTRIDALRGMPLKDLSLSGTRVTDLAPLGQLRTLEKLDLKSTPVADLRPLAGVPLKHVELTNCPVRDLAPLRGAPLEQLHIMGTRVTSLSPLAGMPLKFLDMGAAPVSDFSPLNGLPLEVCNLPGCRLTDLGVFRGSPLRELMLWNCPSARNYAALSEIRTLELLVLPANFRQLPGQELAAIEALRTHPRLKQLGTDASLDHTTTGSAEAFWKDYDRVRTYLARLAQAGAKPRRVELLPDGTLDLDFSRSEFADLTVLQGMPVGELWLADTLVKDLTPLQGTPLKKLHLFNTPVTDLRPLAGLRLEYLNLIRTKVADLSPLRGLPLTGLRLNDCDGVRDVSPLKDCITLRELTLPTNATGCEVLQALPNLKRVGWHEDPANNYRPDQTADEFWQDYDQIRYTKAIDQSGLRPRKISGGWDFENQPIEDLSILRGQPLRSLHLGRTRVADLRPLQGMPLRTLWLFGTRVTDLSPLAGMRLEHLNLSSTEVADLSVLRGMPLVILRLTGCKRLEDVSALKEITTLTDLTLPPQAKNVELLRKLPNLVRVGYEEDKNNGYRPDLTAAEFWANFDRAKEMAKFTAANPPELPKDVLTPEAAVKRMNETVSVRLTVRGSGKSRDDKWYFLNTHDDYRQPENFTIAVRDPTPERLKQLGLTEQPADMTGKTVVARGKVGTFSGRPQLVVAEADWVWTVAEK
ncbi:MAG: protein kinase [Gemmataceae bacterium]